MNAAASVAAVALFGLAATSVLGHGGENLGSPAAAKSISPEEHVFGRQGDPAKVSRTIAIGMSDALRFSPAEIRVKRGETIRFLVRNEGRLLHEMVIGTLEELKEHGELMKKFPTMEHDEPYMAHVAPGKTQEIIWRFTKTGDFRFGCLVPGHLDGGMIGRIIVSGN